MNLEQAIVWYAVAQQQRRYFTDGVRVAFVDGPVFEVRGCTIALVDSDIGEYNALMHEDIMGRLDYLWD